MESNYSDATEIHKKNPRVALWDTVMVKRKLQWPE